MIKDEFRKAYEKVADTVCDLNGLIKNNMPKQDVIDDLSDEDLDKLWQAEMQRILQLISKLEEFLLQMEQDALAQINEKVNLNFASDPKGSFGLYMDK